MSFQVTLLVVFPVLHLLNIFHVESATVPDVSFIDGAIKRFDKVIEGDSPCLSVTYDVDSLAERAELRNGDQLGDSCIAPLFILGNGHKSNEFIHESASHKVHLFDKGHVWIQTDGLGARDEVHDRRYKLEVSVCNTFRLRKLTGVKPKYRFHWSVGQ
ncbi:hypothetical protein C8J56DRAFT_884391 [Mycena floridula]|nr:hypothetical protein C8J56DRAFT_884391 [Mycena floridula]